MYGSLTAVVILMLWLYACICILFFLSKFIVNKNGSVVMQKDKNKATTQISDFVRVVKGGSWLDSAYWLDPGQRRYKNQAKGYGWIGFRVAQDAKNTKTRRTKR